MKSLALLLCCIALASAPTIAQDFAVGTSPAVAAKLSLRGDPYGVVVNELRIIRKNETLVVQADFMNTNTADRMVFYRFKWIDGTGNQVGDGESWKQVTLLGRQVQTIKSVAPLSAASDFRIEMNVELK